MFRLAAHEVRHDRDVLLRAPARSSQSRGTADGRPTLLNHARHANWPIGCIGNHIHSRLERRLRGGPCVVPLILARRIHGIQVDGIDRHAGFRRCRRNRLHHLLRGGIHLPVLREVNDRFPLARPLLRLHQRQQSGERTRSMLFHRNPWPVLERCQQDLRPRPVGNLGMAAGRIRPGARNRNQVLFGLRRGLDAFRLRLVRHDVDVLAQRRFERGGIARRCQGHRLFHQLALARKALQKPQTPCEIKYRVRVAFRRQRLQHLLRCDVRALRHLPGEAVKHQRHHVSAPRLSPHQVEVVQLDRSAIVRHRKVFRLEIENQLVLLVVYHQVQGHLVHIGGY